MTAISEVNTERPIPYPFGEFIGTPWFWERVIVELKKVGVSIPIGASLSAPCPPAYFLFVETKYGILRLVVPAELYAQIQAGDSLVVKYQRARWTPGAVRGKIAH